MLRLRTLGGLTLVSEGAPLTGAATQRRRLAILALLARARDQGLSRDKLLAYLWPESGEERARHVLNQLLYAQRRQFGEQSLFSGRKNLRLNPAVISTDVADFERALEEGLLEAAVAVYGGPFLDGFFLKESPEFEEWAERQRRTLARRYLDALSTLAARAAAQGDFARAASWRQRAAESDPLDSDVALALVQALAESGDRAGAVRAAREYQGKIQAELGLSPDPRVTALLARLA